MPGTSLRMRAISFALSAGAVVFILALLAGAAAPTGEADLARAVIVALICGVMSWGSAERAIAGTAEAIDSVSERLASAAAGDLVSPTPPSIERALPSLGRAMDSMFGQMREQIDRINALARHDPVTGLPNRIHFREQTEAGIAALPPGARGVLLFVDLDRFKAVNDTLGHATGDALLRQVAERLQGAAAEACIACGQDRRSAIVARLAGDEFTLFFPESDDAAGIAARIVGALGQPIVVRGHTIDAGASVGAAVYPEQGANLSQLMRAADIAMYHAKALGRGQMQLYSEALAARIDARAQLEAEMREAIAGGEFALVFQPQTELRGGRVIVAEALLRWNHPVNGLRPAQDFIGAADDSGLICAIGDWGIAEAARALGRWRALGLDQRLAINLSARQIEQPDFALRLRALMAEAGAPLDMLELEMSETLAAALSYGGAPADALTGLRRDGVTVTLDDFGSGYTNIARLGALPVDRVKLAPVIGRGVRTSDERRGIAHNLVSLLHLHGFATIASGIEDVGDAEVLRVIGVDAAQGHGIARPMSELMLGDWLGARPRVVNG